MTPRASALTEAVFCDSCTESLQYATGSWGRIVNSTAKLTLSLRLFVAALPLSAHPILVKINALCLAQPDRAAQ